MAKIAAIALLLWAMLKWKEEPASPTRVARARQVWNRYGDIIRRMAQKYRVPERVILAIILHESGGNPRAVGPTGDYGLMQITRSAAEDTGFTFDPQRLLQDPTYNIEVGTAYLSKLYYHYRVGDWDAVIRAYNGGPAGPRKPQTLAYLQKVKEWLRAAEAVA